MIEEWLEEAEQLINKDNYKLCLDLLNLVYDYVGGGGSYGDRLGLLIEVALRRKAENHDRRVVPSMIAGLRLLQTHNEKGEVDPCGVNDIASDGGTVEPLDNDEINDLVEYINTKKNWGQFWR